MPTHIATTGGIAGRARPPSQPPMLSGDFAVSVRGIGLMLLCASPPPACATVRALATPHWLQAAAAAAAASSSGNAGGGKKGGGKKGGGGGKGKGKKKR